MGEETLYTVTRISTAPGAPLRVFFQALSHALAWNPADADEHPGSPQEVPAAVAAVIESDPSLSPHFRCEPIKPAGNVAPRGSGRRTEGDS